jgi:hypothetical protein
VCDEKDKGMKRFLNVIGMVVVMTCAFAFSQTLDQGDIAQALKRTITLGSGLEQWQDLPQYPVELSNTEEPVTVLFSGYYSVAWDDANLYLLSVFTQPQETIKASLSTDAPEWWNEDTLELFVRSSTGQEKMHFAMNPAGTPFAAFTASTNYQTVSQVEETRWIIEVAFPLSDVLPAVTVGDLWEFKVGRSYIAAKEYSLWPNGGDFQGEENFGRLYFTEALEDPEELYARLETTLD